MCVYNCVCVCVWQLESYTKIYSSGATGSTALRVKWQSVIRHTEEGEGGREGGWRGEMRRRRQEEEEERGG